MKKDFVPFLGATPDGSRPRTESRTEVLARPETANSFHPLPHTPAQPPTGPSGHSEPTVTLERDGDRIARIKVHCPCGNVFELACDYPEEAHA
jgi:hypothetical protein